MHQLPFLKPIQLPSLNFRPLEFLPLASLPSSFKQMPLSAHKTLEGLSTLQSSHLPLFNFQQIPSSQHQKRKSSPGFTLNNWTTLPFFHPGLKTHPLLTFNTLKQDLFEPAFNPLIIHQISAPSLAFDQ